MQQAPWEPKADLEQTRSTLRKYRLTPNLWDGKEDEIKELQKHADYYRVPFARSEGHQENYIIGALKQFGEGWMEGYSANIAQFGDEPDNTAEKISRNLGHLAGFVGVVPGSRISKTIKAINSVTRGRSFPLLGAKYAQNAVAKIGVPAMKNSPRLTKLMADDNRWGDMIKGAFHLGVASGVSDWRGIVDEGMPRALESVGMGAGFGAAFKGLHLLPSFGKRLNPNQVNPGTGMPILSKLEPGQATDIALRTVAGGLVQGMVAQGMSDEELPLEDQVYNYILGGYFGLNESPLHLRISRQAIAETFKNPSYNRKGVPDPELNPKWDTWTEQTQKIVKEDFAHVFGHGDEAKFANFQVIKQAMENEGFVDVKQIEKALVEKYLEVDIDPATGEPYKKVTEAEIKAVKDSIKDNPNNEEYQDLDMHLNEIGKLPGRIAGSNGFVARYLEPRIKDFDTVKRLKESIKVNKAWDALHEIKNGVRVPKKGAIEEMNQWLKNTYKLDKISDKETDFWRNWAEQTRKKKLVLQAYYVDGKVAYINDGVNVIGNKKELAFEPPTIQSIFENVFKVRNKTEDAPNFYVLVDHFVRKGKEYKLNDVMALQQQLNKEAVKSGDPDMAASAEAVIKRMRAKVSMELEKDGYYYAGGRGDKNAMYFVQKHPDLNTGNRHKQLREIREAFKDNGVSEEDFDAHIKRGIDKYKFRFRGMKEDAEKYYLDSFISNAFYEVNNNLGSQYPIEQMGTGLRKVLGKGYIKGAKAYNKRAQIWFNSGLSTNPEVSEYFMNKYYGRYRKELGLKAGFEPLPLRGKGLMKKFRMAIWDDTIPGPESFKWKRPNIERPESFDGAIIALPEYIYGLNKAAGLTNEGNVNKSFIVAPDANYGALLGKYMFFEASPNMAKAMRARGIHALAPKSAIKQMGDRQFAQVKVPGQSDVFTSKMFRDEVAKMPIEYVPHTLQRSRIGEIYVPKEAQGSGVGERFVKALERWRRYRGDQFIDIEAIGGRESFGSKNLDNVEFWKKMGYKVAPENLQTKNAEILPETALNPEARGKKVMKIRMYKELKPRDNDSFRIEGDTYDIQQRHVRTILSEVTSNHDIVNAKWAKQLWSTISHFGQNKTDPKIVKDMANELIGKAVKGEKEANLQWDEHLKSPNAVSERKVLENIDVVSLDRVLSAATDTHNQDFASKVYERILGRAEAIKLESANEAEISREQMFELRQDITEFESIIDRLQEIYPKGNLGFWMHKFAKNYRQSSVRNYIVDRISRPVIQNGGKARMRPWDQGMIFDKNMSRLNTEQDIFFLDNNWKQKRIYDPFFTGGSEKLGTIWKNRQLGEKGPYKENLELVDGILEALNMRVPMDSQSGAHILKFQGFTGMRGNGVLLHGRAMEALGGADLDGDKAFIFFGGRGGVLNKWKSIYRDQVNEFVKGEEMTPAKTQEARDKFVKKDKEVSAYGDNAMSKFDSHWRGHMSEAAVDGRDTLKGAVTTRQALLSAYDSIRLANKGVQYEGPTRYVNKTHVPIIIQDGSYYYPIEIPGSKKIWYMKQTPKVASGALQRFKELSRAAINLGADPMDESGIVPMAKIKEILTDSLFNFDIHQGIKTKKGVKFIRSDKYNSRSYYKLVNKNKKWGLHGAYGKVNNVLYGRNVESGNKWSLGEIQDGINSINWLPKESQNNLMSFLAKEYRQIPYEDNIFRRLNKKNLEDLYKFNREHFKDNPEVAELFERTSMTSRMGKMMDHIIRERIFDQASREALAKNPHKFWDLFSRNWHPQFDETVTGKRSEMGTIPWHLYKKFKYQGKKTSYLTRLQYLEYKLNQAEDFLVNDLSDMASMKHILGVRDKHNIPDKVFKKINKMVNKVKASSYWVKKNRDQAIKDLREVDNNETAEQLIRELNKKNKQGAGANQADIDKMIVLDKRQLSAKAGQQELYDALMLGTFQRTELNALKGLLNTSKNLSAKLLRLKNIYLKHGQNTSLLRLGFGSKSIKDSNIRKHLDEYNKLFEIINKPNGKEVEQILKESTKNENEINEYRNEIGEVVEDRIIEASDLSQADRLYMDQIEPFKGITEGKVKDPELREIYHKLQGHLKHYNNATTRELSGFFRYLFKKNLNQATKYDLKVLERAFQDMRTGSWWSNFMSFVNGKSELPDIQRRYWNIFPAAVNRDMMKNPRLMNWKKDVAPYMDRFGNSIVGEVVRPTALIGELQNFAHKTSEFAIQQSEEETQRLRDELAPLIKSTEEGDILHKIAVAVRERGMVHALAEQEGQSSLLSHKQLNYIKNLDLVKADMEKFGNKHYVVQTKEGAVKMTGEEVWTKINEIYTKQNEKMDRWINGDVDYLEKEWFSLARNKYGKITWRGLDNLRNKFVSFSNEAFRKGERYDIEKFGVNGMQEISKHIILSLTPKTRGKNVRLRTEKLLNQRIKDIGLGYSRTELWDKDAYFPHVSFDRKNVTDQLIKGLKHIFDDKKLTKSEKKKYAQKLVYQSKAMTGDWVHKSALSDNYELMEDIYLGLANKERIKDIQILKGGFKKAYSQHQRDAHLSGWDTTPEAYESYMKNLSDTFYKESMQMLSRVHIKKFHRNFLRKNPKESALAKRWGNFFQLFTQSAMGYPIDIPEAVMNDPKMKIKGTPYKWFADNRARNRIDSIRKTLGVTSKALKSYVLEQADIDALSGVHQSTLQYWGGLEAKWQMASLLAHPKSSITNLYGGTIHTAISAGVDNLKKARDIDWLRANINPNWKSMKDVDRWVVDLGIIEEFLIHEAGLNRQLKGKRFEEFLAEAKKSISNDPAYADTSLNQLRRKYKITDGIWEKASWFMRKPERILRRDAFMSHLIQAKEQFGGAIKQFDHPFLIEMGKRGVKGTQFLYSAPFRPMWTNSVLGRVFSRFQLWSWNSVRFRNDTIRELRIRGYQPGTPAFERAKRLAIADLFMLSMASMFQYSLFDNALPAPWNWFQDTANWLMGDESEREKAFYGNALGPLSIAQPPIARFIQPTFEGLVNGKWDKLADYYGWTALPFGRFMKDVIGKGGMLENPFYSVEKMTGFPLIAGSRYIQKAKENEEESFGLFKPSNT